MTSKELPYERSRPGTRGKTGLVRGPLDPWNSATGRAATECLGQPVSHPLLSAGEGIAAQIFVPGDRPLSVVCTDRPEGGRFTQEQFFSAGSYFDPDAPLVDAKFQRRGHIRMDPAWVIETDGFRIVARWQITQPAVIAAGTFRPGTEHFTLLFFTDAASVQRDGQSIEGQPYLHDIWKPSIGGERSSCVIALAEILLEFQSDDGT